MMDTFFRHNADPRAIRLIQRIKNPVPVSEPPVDPLAVAIERGTKTIFEKNGGINEEGRWLFRRLFSWDYMGAAEFEMGSTPYALAKMYEERDHYVVTSIEISRADIPVDTSAERIYSGRLKALDGDAKIHILCRKNHADTIFALIRDVIKDGDRETHTKERTQLPRAIKYGNQPPGSETIAWLDLNNGSFWSIEEKLTQAMALLLCRIKP